MEADPGRTRKNTGRGRSNCPQYETSTDTSQHSNFDPWELLSAFQALLVYCLLRLLEDPVGNDSFDVPLLVTVRVSNWLVGILSAPAVASFVANTKGSLWLSPLAR